MLRKPTIASLSRRQIAFGMGAVGIGLLATRGQALAQAVSFIDYPFSLGVASGDPASDGFVIWTRLAPRPMEPGYGMGMRPVGVQWEVGTDPSFREIAAKGDAVARPELGHAVHVEVSGLQPDRPYWYRFIAAGERSAVGRSKTTAALGSAVAALKFAVVGCQHYESGFYDAYRHMSREADLDFVFHYGDYIYEGRRNPQTWSQSFDMAAERIPTVRQHIGDELFTLEDYRRRYAQTKLDVDQQVAHAAAPWIVTWDDHEVDNNWVQDIDENGTPPEVFTMRRFAAFQAFYEANPLRRASMPTLNGLKLHRRIDFGNLLRVHALDTRQYRSDQPCGDSVKPQCAGDDAPEATVLGAQQEAWLNEGLDTSKATFNLLAQQIMVMHLDRRETAEETTPVLNHDSWNGYRAARARLMQRLDQRGQRNVVIATGDEHQNFAGDIFRNPERPEGPIVATEFVSTSITSNGDGQDLRKGWDRILANNPHCKLANNQRGYTLSTVTPKALTTEFKVLDQVRKQGGTLSVRARYAVEPGKPGWVAA